VCVPVVVKPVPVEHDLVTIPGEVRHVATLDASPSEHDLPPKVFPREIDALGLDGLELGEVSATGQEAGLGQASEDRVAPHLAGVLPRRKPELGAVLDLSLSPPPLPPPRRNESRIPRRRSRPA
jgi:hypothetical protein